LGYVHSGRLQEAAEALQPIYTQPRFTSKRHMEYFGIITSMPDVVRGELLLAEKDFQQLVEYDLESHGYNGDVSEDAVLPDLLRIKGGRSGPSR